MIDRSTEEQATLYVLDLLSEEEKCVFDERVAGNPELGRLVRQLKAGLYAPVKTLDGPSRPELLDGILSRVESVQKPVTGNPEATAVSIPWSYIWAIAALIFLGLNLSLLVLLKQQRSYSGVNTTVSAADSDSSDSNGIEGGAIDQRAILEARIARLETDLSERDSQLELILEDRRELKDENEEVKSFNSGWQREYNRLAARFLPFFEPNDGLSRFTVIEMVDEVAYNEDIPRLGFNELAARYLSGEGNIGGVGSREFMGPFVEGAGVASATTESGQSGLMPIARGESAFAGDPGSDVTTTSTDQNPAKADGLGVIATRPAGFTVWRDDEQKGFLDIYNLPEPVDGEQAFLWARSSDLEDYIAVGTLPDLNEGTGSMFYSVDEPNFTPAEILITSESPDTRGDTPQGAVLLRGP